MTGVNYKKIRHYAPGIEKNQKRFDPDIAALLFKAGVRVTSSTERLIADVSIKAAMPSALLNPEDSDGKKRGLESKQASNVKNYAGMVFEPTAKQTSDSYLKLHVTEPERKAALMSHDPVPNFGWVKYGETNTRKVPSNVKVSVTRHRVDPRTGKPIASTGYDPYDPFAPYMNQGMREKALGRTIGESRPGQKLIHFTAKATGLIIDALGKFRCPPGTPAANRFTNERGEGCFAITAVDLAAIATSIANIMSDGGGVSMTENLLRSGIAAAEIRKVYKESGLRGLASLAERILGGPGHLVGEKYNDPSYRAAIAPTLRDAMRLTEGKVERMARIAAEKKRRIEELKNDPRILAVMARRGVSFTGDDEKDLIKLLEAIGEIPEFGLAADGHVFYVGGNETTHKKWVRGKFFEQHSEAIQHYYGALTPAQLEDKYNTDIAAGGTPFTMAIDDAMRRERELRIGAFEQIALDAIDKPQSLKDIRITVDFDAHTGPGDLFEKYNFEELNGMAAGGLLYVGSGPAIQGHRGAPPAGHMDLYQATGGSQEEQWAAIAAAIAADETGRHWAFTYGVDLAATFGSGWRDFGAQAAAHEVYHFDQVVAIANYLHQMHALEPGRYPAVDLSTMDSNDLFNLAHEFLTNADPQMLREALGADIEDLITARLDGVAGAYSGDTQQSALEAIAKAGLSSDPNAAKAANAARSIALLETMTELAANRKVGLIGDDPALDRAIDTVFSPPVITLDGIPPLPGGSTTPDGAIPDTPTDAPRPSRPAWGDMWWSAEDISIEVPEAPETGGSGSGGGGRVHDPFGGRRTSDIARKIRDGEISTDDVRDLFDGKPENPSDPSSKRKGGLFATWRAQRKMRISSDNKGANDREKKKYINDLMDELPLDEVDLNDMRDSLLRGDTLFPDEEAKLVETITKLREKYLEAGQKLEEARAFYDAGCPPDVMARDVVSYDDVGPCRLHLEMAERRVKQWEDTQSRLGRGLIAPINDIWDLNEYVKTNGSLPGTRAIWGMRPDAPEPLRREYLGGMASVSKIASSQNVKLSPDEIALVSSAFSNIPLPATIGMSPAALRDRTTLNRVYEKYGVSPTFFSDLDDIESVVPVLRVLDKTTIDDDLIVETEMILDSKNIGSVFETNTIETLRVMDSPDNIGFASTSGGRSRKAAGIAGRLLNSKAARKTMRRMGIDPENEDLVDLAAETALVFSVGGPAAAIIPIARRGSKDAADAAIKMMVAKGWITQSVAGKISQYGIDRIAKEGLPQEIIDAMKTVGVAVTDEETKRNALRMAGVLQERSTELKKASAKLIAEIRQRIEEMTEKSAFLDMEIKELGAGIGANNVPKNDVKAGQRKSKVRVVVPAGSKAKVDESGEVMIPPGKMKITNVDKNGVVEAEVTEQTSAIDYMKKAEENLIKSMKKTTDEGVKKLLSTTADKYKKAKRDEMISSQNSANSDISKITLEKAETIIGDAKEMGYALFNENYVYVNGEKVEVNRYYDLFTKSMTDAIKEIKQEAEKELFVSDTKLNNYLITNSVQSIYSSLIGIAGSIFGGIDRRTRISMSKTSLQDFLTSGRIANVDVDSRMLSAMKLNRDKIIGGENASVEFTLTPVEIIHEFYTNSVEQSLYASGTKIGSEEFADYGRGIEVIIRSENANRIGYGRSDSYETNGIYSMLTDDSQKRIVMTIFSDVMNGIEKAKDSIILAIQAKIKKDYSQVLKNNSEENFEAFLVGEISLNDIEHIKIPVSIFEIEKKPMSQSHPFAGKNRISSELKKRGKTDSEIKDFFDKGGLLGGGYNPKYLTYLLQVESAIELRDRLISFGIPEVIFTNKNGIDIMAEGTWATLPPNPKTGIDALRMLAKMEVRGIIEKVAPSKASKKPEKVAS